MTTNSNRITVASVQHPISERKTLRVFQRAAKYVVSAGLGIVGGGVGVASTMACIVGIQHFYVTEEMFLPSLTVVAVFASIMGLCSALVIYHTVRKISPFALLRNLNQNDLQIICVASVLISLLETFLFMQNIFTGLSTQIHYIWV